MGNRKFWWVMMAAILTVSLVQPVWGGKGKVEIAYVEWDSEVASTNVVNAVLKEKMGYDVEITPVSAAAMWQAVGSGDVDAMVAAWLPTTHGHYLKKVADAVVNLGPNINGTRIGLVVPDYVTINTIDELNSHADKFDGKLIGIDPGAGLMTATEKVIKEYKLKGFELIEGSGATMCAELKNRIEQKKWVAVTGWTPHWKFARWKLKYLDDPKGIYGGAEHIATIARKGLYMDMPEVYLFLDKFKWNPEDMQKVMVWIAEGVAPYEAAVRWVNENPDKVNKWLEKD